MGSKPKVRVFIGSSTEGVDVADALETRLMSRGCDVTLWTEGFDLSDTFMESLEEASELAEFAVMVLTPDDARTKRGADGQIPRDNVVFELGLFMGKLGRGRTFAVRHPKAELPTDLSGVSVVDFDPDAMDRDPGKAIGPVATKILHAIKQAPVQPTDDEGQERLLPDRDALFNEIVSWPSKDVEIVALTDSTTWAWSLIPTLLHWRLNGATVRVLAPPIVHRARKAREQAIRKLLVDLGVMFEETATLPVSGFFLRTRYPDDDCAIVIGEAGTPESAVRYTGKADSSAVQALHSRLPPHAAGTASFVPTLVDQGLDEVITRLRTVKQYSAPKTKIDPIEAATEDLWLMSPYARHYKFEQIKKLRDAYDQVGSTPFSALAVQLASGGTSIITPPVVEESAGKQVVIEGTTRATYCYENGVAEYPCLRVRGVEDGLPGEPTPIKKVTIARRSVDEEKHPRYRNVERAVHPIHPR